MHRRGFLFAVGALALSAAGARLVERSHMSETKIALAVWNGVEELDLVGPYEVLTAWAASTDDQVSVTTVAETNDTVRCAHGLRLLPDATWSDVDDLDVFVLPGGNSSVQLEDPRFLERIRGLARDGTLMTSVCTGALVYAKAGLLDGRPATTHWGSLDSLAAYGNDVRVDRKSRVVDDGEVITSAGVSAGIDMALHLVARLDSEERSREVRRYIQYEAA